MISRILNSLLNWFKVIWEFLFGKNPSNNGSIEAKHNTNQVLITKKRFRIINENSQDSIISDDINKPIELSDNPSEKRFSITSETNYSSSNSITYENNKFKVYGGTRPKRCPYCLTANKITRIEDGNTWKCKECDHEW